MARTQSCQNVTWWVIRICALGVVFALGLLCLAKNVIFSQDDLIMGYNARFLAALDKRMYPMLELPLPQYTPHYNSKAMHLSELEKKVCTVNDPFLENSEPHPSKGCHKQDKLYPGISFFCLTPIRISCSLTRSDARELFYRNLLRTTMKCDGLTDVGNPAMDGVWRICMTKPFDLKKDSCLVYSFGINNEWSFDDAISKKFRCEVHSFDPTIGKEDHKRDERITFHNMGVSGHGERFEEARKKGWGMKTLKEIIHFLGHDNRTIDILKVDIEYTEWDAFEDALRSNALKNVKQIATEFHVWNDSVKGYIRFHRIIVALENAGFEKWFVGRKAKYDAINQETGQLSSYFYQADFGFINTKFLT